MLQMANILDRSSTWDMEKVDVEKLNKLATKLERNTKQSI